MREKDYTVRLAAPGDEESIGYVIGQTWLSTYPSRAHQISADMIYPRHFDCRGRIKPDKVAHTRYNIERMGDDFTMYVAELGRSVVGITSVTADTKRYLRVLYVLPWVQGQGMGRELFDAAMDWHGSDDDVYLKVATYNTRALSFYARHGFQEVGSVEGDNRMIFDNGVVLPEVEMVRPGV